MYDVIRRPLISEKNAVHAEAGSYAFEVDKRASKLEIKSAVEKAFRVKVANVRTMICRGKFFRKQARLGPPKQWKKALVRLRVGDKISIFEGA